SGGHAPASAGSAWPAATAQARPPTSRGARLRSSVADMLGLVAGIGAAVGASTLYSLGIALQALDARETPHEEHLRLALVVGLVRRSRWLLGTGMSILGFPLQILALMLAPLVVVQPALAAGLLVLLFVGQRMLGEHAGRYEHLAMCGIVIGVVGIAFTAPARSTTHTSQQLT